KFLEDVGYDGPRHFDAHAYRTEDYRGVLEFARGCMRTYLILRERAKQWHADAEIQALVASVGDAHDAPNFSRYSQRNRDAPRAAAPGRVMILDGESGGPYHRWQVVTPVLKKILVETALFTVDVVTAPPPGADFSAFEPAFTQYAAVVMNYDAPDDRWPASVK